MKKVNEGLIFTNEKCVNCNRCIGVCSCPGATIATETEDGKNVIRVDSTRCIGCGACLDACEHHAREYADDTVEFIKSLKNGEDVSILVAPAMLAVYPEEYKEILGKLKALGVNRIYSVAYGADITTWAYLNYISTNNFTGCISQPCPAVVEYIEKYIPELIPKLIPVQSPLMCMAIYARKYLGVCGKLAFIGPCIAKKNEIMSPRGKGMISYNVTFNHLMKKLKTMDITPEKWQMEQTPGLGAVYSKAGGLKENIYWFLGGNALVRQVEGEKNLYKYLMLNRSRILDAASPYTLIDALNCTDGCLCGTGVENADDIREDVLLQIERIKAESTYADREGAWSETLAGNERLKALNEQFKELDMEDFICSYEDKSAVCMWKTPSKEELNRVFDDMNKETEEQRRINCSSCGYDSCMEMATAIFNGFNHKENCVHFIKDVMQGLLFDYPTVALIHEKAGTMNIIKYTGEGDIRRWIEKNAVDVDYTAAIADYAEHYVDVDDRERFLRETGLSVLRENMEKDGCCSVVYTRHTENGHTGYFELDYSKAEGKNDIVMAFHDVDHVLKKEREKEKQLGDALEAAKAANRAKSTFLANMSHEIRTPINAILGMDTMILRESTQENVLEYARNVNSAGNTLLSLINDILDFSKIESGKMEIVNGRYRLDLVIHDMMNMMRTKAEDKGLKLELEMQPGIPSQLFGDEVRLKQIILNILNNAVKYTREGIVTLSLGYEQTDEKEIKLCVAVKDTGIGIREEDMEILFSPYERLEENKNKLIEGTGLGLSITRDLLIKMGSELKVESVYGRGSVFSFSVKQGVWGSERISREQMLLAGEKFESEKSEVFHAPDAAILAVDDVQMNLTVLCGLLKRTRIKPDCCMSGAEALKLAEKKKYDIIFLDAMMPGLSGEETLHEMRKSCSINDKTPVIVLTANALVGAREKYIEEGFTDYLSKPIDGNQLEKMIREFLPAEKILAPGNDDEKEDAVNPENTKILAMLGKAGAISVTDGVQAAGGEDTYIAVCRNFLETGAVRMDMIREYFEKSDIKNYTIQVHALKSSARLIGAGTLSKAALDMENAGRAGDETKIREKTPELMAMYESTLNALKAVFKPAAGEKKKEIKPAKLKKRLGELLELVEAFDMESAGELSAELDKFELPDKEAKICSKLKALLADVNRDDIIILLNEYLEGNANG